jgi:hypothetical protein
MVREKAQTEQVLIKNPGNQHQADYNHTGKYFAVKLITCRQLK